MDELLKYWPAIEFFAHLAPLQPLERRARLQQKPEVLTEAIKGCPALQAGLHGACYAFR
jgi:hypothetical protein